MSKTVVYLIAMPCGGEISDISMAALEIIPSLQHIFVETMDARVIQYLKEKHVLSPHQQLYPLGKDDLSKARELLSKRENFAIMADSGNPCFVDPGCEIVEEIFANHLESTTIVPIGMSSALDAALSMSGVDIRYFLFAGHYPENFLSLSDISSAHSMPIFFYVRGDSIEEWMEDIQTNLPFLYVNIFLNVRDPLRYQIYRWKNTPPTIKNDPSNNIVAMVYPHVQKRITKHWWQKLFSFGR